MDFVNCELKNHKMSLFYEDNEPYFSLEFDALYSNGKQLHTKIHKIDLSKIVLDLHYNNHTNFYLMGFINNSMLSNNSQISFDLALKDNEFYTVTDVTSYKEMTLNEVEKELGYKIKIKK